MLCCCGIKKKKKSKEDCVWFWNLERRRFDKKKREKKYAAAPVDEKSLRKAGPLQIKVEISKLALASKLNQEKRVFICFADNEKDYIAFSSEGYGPEIYKDDKLFYSCQIPGIKFFF